MLNTRNAFAILVAATLVAIPDCRANQDTPDGQQKALLEKAEKALQDGNPADAIPPLQKLKELQAKDAPQDRIDTIETLGLAQEAVGNLKAAYMEFQELKPLYVAVFGKENSATVDCGFQIIRLQKLAALPRKERDAFLQLQQQAVGLAQGNEFAKAVEALNKLEKEIIAIFGKDHPEYADCLNMRVFVYQNWGKPKLAEADTEACLKLRKRLLGDSHPDYAQSLNAAAGLARSMYNYRLALKYRRELMPIVEESFGKTHFVYALCLNNLATAEEDVGDFSSALSRYEEAVSLAEASTEGPARLTGKLNNLADLYRKLSRFDRSEETYLKAQRLLEDAKLTETPEYAILLFNFAGLKIETGRPQAAIDLIDACLRTRGKVFGKDTEAYAMTITRKAELLEEFSDFEQAESLYKQALSIREQIEPEGEDVANSLKALGFLYGTTERLEAAESALRRSLKIRGDVFGKDSYRYAQTASALGNVLARAGNLKEAETLLQLDARITKAQRGADHPEYAMSVSNLGTLAVRQGKLQEALENLDQALRIQREQLGADHVSYRTTLGNKAVALQVLGRTSESAQALEEVLDLSHQFLTAISSHTSERQQLRAIRDHRDYLDRYLTVMTASSPKATSAYRRVLRWKGLVSVTQRDARLAADDPQSRETLQQLHDVMREWSLLANSRGETAEQDAVFRERREQLFQKKEKLEARLVQLSASGRSAAAGLTEKSVGSALSESCVLIDFLVWHRAYGLAVPGSRRTDLRRLAAFVLQPNGSVSVTDLGPMKPIEQNIAAWRASFGTSDKALVAGTELRQKLWQPLLEAIGSADTILISPDDVLGHLPFNALPGRKPNTFLIEDHRIATVAVPQLLPSLSRLNKPRAMSTGLLLVGAVDYGKNPQGEAKPWQPLTNGDREISDISKLYSDQFPDQPIQTLRGTQATESKVYDSISRFQIQHYSTHGFFETNPSTFSDTSRRSGEQDYSGLVLANANQPRNYEGGPRAAPGSDMFDDGRLTAEELTAGRMNSVELVFFSACNSGLGGVTSGEGLIGLQRAVQLAGVRSTIATLWHVDTDFSRLISTTFYENLWSGVDQDGNRLSRLDALRNAQLAVLRGQVRIDTSTGTVLQLKGPGASAPANLKAPPRSNALGNRIPPYYWAAYTLSGDWR